MPTSRNRDKKPSFREQLRRGYQSGRAKPVSNRSIRRQALYAIEHGAKVYSILLAVLAQKGGEIVVTKGTIDQVGANFGNLSYVVVPGENENEFIIRMVEGKESTEKTDEPAGVPGTTDDEPVVVSAEEPAHAQE